MISASVMLYIGLFVCSQLRILFLFLDTGVLRESIYREREELRNHLFSYQNLLRLVVIKICYLYILENEEI